MEEKKSRENVHEVTEDTSANVPERPEAASLDYHSLIEKIDRLASEVNNINSKLDVLINTVNNNSSKPDNRASNAKDKQYRLINLVFIALPFIGLLIAFIIMISIQR
jgi:hypothetical protein